MVRKFRLHLDIAFTYVPRGLIGRSLEVDYTVGKHGGFISIGLRNKTYGGRPWLTGMIGKHAFTWR